MPIFPVERGFGHGIRRVAFFLMVSLTLAADAHAVNRHPVNVGTF